MHGRRTAGRNREGETGLVGQGKAEQRAAGGGSHSIMADPINARLGGQYDLC